MRLKLAVTAVSTLGALTALAPVVMCAGPSGGAGAAAGPAGAAFGPEGRPFEQLGGLTVDLHRGTLYFLDAARSTIFRVPPGGGSAELLAGTGDAGFNGDGKGATETWFHAPSALSLDPRTGELFVADTRNYRVRAIDLRDLRVRTVAGVGLRGVSAEEIPAEYVTPEGLAVGRYGGDGGPAEAAELNLPSGVAADPFGILFIADSGNHRVRAVNRGTSPVIVMGVEIGPGAIETIAGTGKLGFSGDGGQATAAALAFPTGLALDAAGSLLVVDSFNQRIRKVDRQSGRIRTVARGALSGITPERALVSWSTSIVGVAVTPGQEIVFTDRVDRSIHRLSRGGKDRVIYTAKPRDAGLGSVAVGVGGEVFAADDHQGTILVLTADTARAYVGGRSVPGTREAS